MKTLCKTIFILTFVYLAAPSILAMPSYNDVLLVINTKSPESQQIGAYFKDARKLPDVNVCNISVTPCLGTGMRMTNTEKWAALAVIKNHLIKNKLADKINYIVLTHGTPKYAYTGEKGKNYGGDEIDMYHLFDIFLMYQLSESAADIKIPNIFTNNKFYYYNNELVMKLNTDAPEGQLYIDLKDASFLKPGNTISLTNGVNNNTYTVASMEAMSGYYRFTLTNPLYFSYTTANGAARSLSDNAPKLTKKFSQKKFGYYIVGRLDGLGTTTVKSMIDNTGAPAYESYKKQANGKMKLLTLTPHYMQPVISEIFKRENLEIVSPTPIPGDIWNPETQTTTLVDNADSTITLQKTFNRIGKDTMFCFLNNVAWDSFYQWPMGNPYYASGDYVEEYPFIYRGATFLPGSIMMIYRSNPAAYDSHGAAGGTCKMDITSKKITSFVKLDASDMKFRHQTCTEYDPLNNQVWAGTGKNQLDITITLGKTCTDDAHRENMLNYGGGIVIYDAATGAIQNWINASEDGSPLKNNRVTSLVYDKNSKYMWVAHYKGIQYYDLMAKTWNDIPELQNDYAAAIGIYLDPFDNDKVYFSFYYNGKDADSKKASSKIPGADTGIFEYSKSARIVTHHVIDASTNKGISPKMGKTAANILWVSKGNSLYRYNLSSKSIEEKFDMNTIIPEKINPPVISKTVSIDPIRNVISIPSAKVAIATVACNITYEKDLIEGTASKFQRKNYIVRIIESADPKTNPSVVETINTDKLNSVAGEVIPEYEIRDIAKDPSTNGKTIYMALSTPYASPVVMRSTDGAGVLWQSFSTDTALNSVNGIALDGKGFLYAAKGYRVSQNIVVDFQAFGLCAHGGGMTHDDMKYASTAYSYSYEGAYTAPGGSWLSSSGIRGVSQMEPMMFMLLDGFYTGEARLGVHKCYPTTGGGGHIGHMTVFEPKCAPFAPRVNESMIPANPQVKDKTSIEIPILSPGLPWHMNDVIMSTVNKDTIQITDDTGALVTPTGYSFEKPSGPDPSVDGKSFVTGTGKLIISGNFATGILYKVKLICGINGIKNIKGASLTNTRPNEFKDDITLEFGNGFDISKGTYKAPEEITGPVKMPMANSKCDLIVDKVWWDGTPVAGQPLTVKLRIKNIGTAKTNAAPMVANVYWNNILIGTVEFKDLNAKGVVDSKNPSVRDSVELSVVLDKQYVIAGRKNVIMVKADGTDKLDEIRESNNTNFATFFIDTRPDLLVKEITLSSLKAGKTTVNFKIANAGFGPTAAGAGAQTAAVYVNSKPVGTVNYDDLAKGAVLSTQLANVSVTSGICKVKVIADSAAKISEVNENNNSLEKTFIIK